MKVTSKFIITSALLAIANFAQATITLNTSFGYLRDSLGNPIADGSAILLVANTTDGSSDWSRLTGGAAFNASQTFTVGSTLLDASNIMIVGSTTINSSGTRTNPGSDLIVFNTNYTGAYSINDRLGLVWFTLSSGQTSGDWGFISSSDASFASPADGESTVPLDLFDSLAASDYRTLQTPDVFGSIQNVAGSNQFWALNPVPEPSHAALIFGLMAVGLVARRRRR